MSALCKKSDLGLEGHTRLKVGLEMTRARYSDIICRDSLNAVDMSGRSCWSGIDSRNVFAPLARPFSPGVLRIRLLAEQESCTRKSGVDFHTIMLFSDTRQPTRESRE